MNYPLLTGIHVEHPILICWVKPMFYSVANLLVFQLNLLIINSLYFNWATFTFKQ
jgi:hypothetical protein